MLDAAGRRAEAVEAGRAAIRKAPSLALALALAQRIRLAGDRDAAAWMVRDAVESEAPSPWTWEVMREAAAFLAADGRKSESIGLYRKLLDTEGIPFSAAKPWLEEARRVALESGDTAQAAEWEEELSRDAQTRIGGVR